MSVAIVKEGCQGRGDKVDMIWSYIDMIQESMQLCNSMQYADSKQDLILQILR